MLFIKLFFTPICICVSTLITRRFGAAIGGLFTSMPFLAGPISYFNCIEQGTEFAINSAHSSILGYAAIGLCVFPFLAASKRGGWPSAIIFGSIAFFLAAYLMKITEGSITNDLILTIGILALSIYLLPHTVIPQKAYTPKWWDLPLRAVTSAAIVIGITEAANLLGPQWSGFTSTYPSMSFLMATFTLAQSGYDSTVFYWRGMLSGLMGSVLFFYALIYALMFCPVWMAYCLALVANIVANILILWIAILIFRHCKAS